jgi:drug/metabolite transporter (DMT)-like permease
LADRADADAAFIRPKPSSATSIQLLLLGAMMIWGLNVSAVKLLTASFEPALLASLRMVVASVALSVIVLMRRGALPTLSRRQWLALVVCAALMIYANQLLLAEGLLRSQATNGSLIMALSPLASTLLAALAFGERMTWQRLAGIALGFAGVAAVVLSHPDARLSSAGLGDMMLVGGVLVFSIGGVVVQRLARQMDAVVISWLITLIGTAMLVAHTGLKPASWQAATYRQDWGPWVLLLFSGVLSTALGSLVWNQAIARIGVARAAVALYWVPIFGVGFAALWLGERLTAWHAVGFVGVMLGTWLGTRGSPLVRNPPPDADGRAEPS